MALAPFLPALLAAIPGLHALGRPLESWFAFQCERDASRSFAGVAVCARCTGIYVGLGLGALLARPRLSLTRQQLWIAAAALALWLDVATEDYGLRSAAAWLRLLTGFALAYPIGVLIVTTLTAPAPASE